MLPVAMAQSSDGSAICYLFPVLWMTSCFHITESKATIIWAQKSGTSAEGANHRVRVPPGVWRSVVSSPSGVRGQRFFVYTDKIRVNFWPPMNKHTAAEKDKYGQIRDTKQAKNWTNGCPGRTVIFFWDTLLKSRTVPAKKRNGWSP